MITDLKTVALNPNRALDNLSHSRTVMGSFFRNYVKKCELAVACGIVVAAGIGLVEALIYEGPTGPKPNGPSNSRHGRR